MEEKKEGDEEEEWFGLWKGGRRKGERSQREEDKEEEIRMYVHFYLIFFPFNSIKFMTEQGSVPKGSTVIFTVRSTENQ